MDGQRFDALAKALAGRGTRRRLLRGLAAGAAGGAFIVTGRAQSEAYTCRADGVLCLKGADCCSGFCNGATHRCVPFLGCFENDDLCSSDSDCCSHCCCKSIGPCAGGMCKNC